MVDFDFDFPNAPDKLHLRGGVFLDSASGSRVTLAFISTIEGDNNPLSVKLLVEGLLISVGLAEYAS